MHIFIYSFNIIYSDEEETFFLKYDSNIFLAQHYFFVECYHYYYYNHYYRICLTFEIDCWNIHFTFRHTLVLVYDIKNKILFNMKFQFNASFPRIYMQRTRFDVYFDIPQKTRKTMYHLEQMLKIYYNILHIPFAINCHVVFCRYFCYFFLSELLFINYDNRQYLRFKRCW